MAQHDYNLANQTFPSMRGDINNALSSVVSLNSGASAPSTTFSYMLWADTTNNILKQRNGANNAWIIICPLDNDGCTTKRHTANPNGAIAAEFVGQLCFDTTAKKLYVATVAGNAATAVWNTDYIVAGAAGGGVVKRNVFVSGSSSAVNAGSGRVPQFLADTTDAIFTFAYGYDANGNQLDYTGLFTSDSNFPTVPANSTAYLFMERNTVSGALSLGISPIAPYYQTTQPVTGTQSLLHFDGANNSTTFTDSVGGTWIASGDAKISTTQSKYGGASGYFDGTGDFITGPSGVYPTGNEWCIEGWVRFDDQSTGYRPVFSSDTISFVLGRSWNVINRIGLSLSSNGSTYDIQAQSADGSTAIADNTWYHLALVFTGSAYKVYLNGTLEITVNSSTKIFSTATKFRIGRENTQTYYFKGYVDDFAYYDYAKYTANFTPPASALTTTGQDSWWFDTKNYLMKYGNSVSGWTNKQAVFVGEAIADASTITSVRQYAFNGRAEIEQATLAVGTKYTLNHNIGTKEVVINPYLENKTAEGGFVAGDKLINLPQNGTSGLSCTNTGANTLAFTVGSTNLGSVSNNTNGGAHTLTAANWKAKAIVERSF